jgi:oligopeptide transport system ATP-binding protein
MTLLAIDNLAISFHTRRGTVRAVRGVSLSLGKGETLGIVGESGSGKSVTCMALFGLLPKSASIDSGRIDFDGTELVGAPEAVFRTIRGKRIGMVFQDPMSALNPYLRVSTQLTEALRIHGHLSLKQARDAAVEELEAVGLPDAATRIDNYPHQFSGGQRQRIMIATALLQRPDLLIADEPTTALDVTVQAQILELLKARQKELGTSIILITHNLGVAAAMCDRIQVMYAGRIMESGLAEEVLNRPAHPYTDALKRSIPSGESGAKLVSIPGAPPHPSEAIEGCPFAPRCTFSTESCKGSCGLEAVENSHLSACPRVRNKEISLG